MRRYILLLRHGATQFDRDQGDAERPLKNNGADVKGVAAAFAEHLSILPEGQQIVLGQIWHGTYRQVIETENIVFNALQNQEDIDTAFSTRPYPDLDPCQFWQDRTVQERQKIGRKLLRHVKKLPYASTRARNPSFPNAVLVIGHAPQLGWIAETILGQSHPIHRAELVCIAIESDRARPPFRRRAWVEWVISPSDDEAMAAVRQKIKSKMDLAGILGSLIIGVVGLSLLDANQFSSLLSQLDKFYQFFLCVAAACLLLALALYFATLYAYDQLLMPTRFWAEKANVRERPWLVRRPPSSSLWVLYQNMIRTWNRLFMPATYLVVFGLICLTVVVLRLNKFGLFIVFVLGIITIFYIRQYRPVLGVDD